MHTSLPRHAALSTLLLTTILMLPVQAADTCDRSCLEGFINQYLAAYAARDPGPLPLADEVVFVENGQEMALGEGTWRTVEGLGGYRHYFSDPQTGEAALISVIHENGTSAIYNLRLKIADGRMSEIETMVIRDPRGSAIYEEMGQPDAVWLEPVPERRRISRERLAATADKYLSGMQNDDGKGDYSFFADNCSRIEHGRRTARSEQRQNYGHSQDTDFMTMTCAQQFATGFLGFVTRIRDRRYLVDEERQAVFALTALDHNGTIRNIYQTNGVIFPIPAYFSAPRSLQVGEGYRIENEKLVDIEMILYEPPYGMQSPFADTPLDGYGMAEACGRDCLEQLIDELLGAMVTNQPTRVELAVEVSYTENSQPLLPGDGIWGTLTHVGDYRLYFSDPGHGRAGVIARVSENQIPGILALNVRVKDKQIHAIESVIVREEKPGVDTLMRPKLLIEPDPIPLLKVDPVYTETVPRARRSSREEIKGLINRYFDAVAMGTGGDVPFARDCDRRENGVMVTNNSDIPRPPPPPAPGQAPAGENMWSNATGAIGSVLDPARPDFRPFALGCAEQIDSGFFAYIGRIRDRSEPIIDEERGLAYVTAWVDIPGNVRTVQVAGVGEITLPSVLGVPYTLMSPYVFKIEDGKIRRMESLGRSVPYGMKPRKDL